jgi:hypothetical protein
LFGQLQFGANTIGGGDQNGIGKTRGAQIEQTTKPAKVGLGTGASCALCMRADIAYQRITSINIDTSITISQGFWLFLSGRHAGLNR